MVQAGLDTSRAVDLGRASATETVRPGSLDLAGHPDATDVYKFALPAGGGWDVALGISARRDGGTLNPTVTLYDAQGREIATADQERSDSPTDPSLTRRLDAGTYYLAVSGSLPSGTTDGVYRVHLAASPASSSIAATAIAIDRANPNSDQPTGITVHFSGPIDLDPLRLAPDQAVSLVDSQGRSWPLSASGVAAYRTAISFVLDRGLPAGTYAVQLGDTKALVALDGRTPTTLDGTLGTIVVAPSSRSTPDDLGTLWGVNGSSVSGSIAMAPGETTTRTFTVLATGSQTLDIQGDPSQFQVDILDAHGHPYQGTTELTADSSLAGLGRRGYLLTAGTYTMSLTNLGDVSGTAHFTITMQTGLGASLLDTGVGQGERTSGVKVVAPTSTTPVGLPTTPAAMGSDSASPSSFVKTAGAVPSATVGASAGGKSAGPGETTGATLLTGGVPVGRPSPSLNRVVVVGPSGGLRVVRPGVEPCGAA